MELRQRKLDMCMRFIQPKAENYHKFIGLMIAVAKKHIPRGFRKKYIPGWSEESQSLYEEFEDSGNPETADHLLRSLDASRMDKWINDNFHVPVGKRGYAEGKPKGFCCRTHELCTFQ
ncbi:hypothetical protein JTB14_014774 [Gonioctena quinquepunctata]|nr:hypothetical protein JTB14_014774 [Gonioctena quinquepunctata]